MALIKLDQVASERGADWYAMTEAEREDFIDDVVYEN
jgi:hypothetical protein